ncbi:DUF1177 domain-containing protein [Vulcanisaeta souniana]|uniref:DUF1177 domain-containing protein n=1 Tax=Vulcanisaeta souniana JCM 11219 TaxID=1293586 RepID=A0A830E2G8_9CREN|nr:DUF1177 domain-containing protein [Vulcanisaeta souniana]BDR91025.1 hypothetical protein Vsou_01180 [Vulcanisaeta souniana JCM 11219]GGI80109.1 hypothetical protein GCM10007112_16330 [Vulcanisaeta souniana JCM 11219]
MSLVKYILDVIGLLDDPKVDGDKVHGFFKEKGLDKYMVINVERIKGDKGSTDFIKIIIPGTNGKSKGGNAPTLGVIGRLGGVGARPLIKGLVSDADGAIIALAVAYKLADMVSRGDELVGDVIITTHVCPNAVVTSHKPAPLISSPVDILELLRREVDSQMDGILSIDATKANLVVKGRGFAITPTIKDGWILKVSEDLINIYMWITGHLPIIVPITLQDVLPFSTPVYHINSIIQPWLYTHAPVVGIATITETVVPGSATDVANIVSLDEGSRFVIKIAKEFTSGNIRFYDENEWNTIVKIHGSIRELLLKGSPVASN